LKTARLIHQGDGMENNHMTENKKGFLQNDRLLVCSMLVFYGLCLIGLIAATFWWLDRSRQAVSANETATAVISGIQQANATSTAITHATELAQYEFIERFDMVSGRWLTGVVNSEYWKGRRAIQDESYLWEVKEVKKTFISWADFYKEDKIGDFDVYVDTKVIDSTPGDVCSGFLFRISPDGWDNGGYYFALCSNSLTTISYHTEKEGWERIATIPYYERSNDWNRLEIIARGTRFTFLINGNQIYEMEDDRQKLGGLALVIELNEKVSAKVIFDNFGYQSR
jgi:hypothetical protein